MARQRPQTFLPAPDGASLKHKVAAYPSTTARSGPTPAQKRIVDKKFLKKLPVNANKDAVDKLTQYRLAKHEAYMAQQKPSITPCSQMKSNKRKFIDYASPSSSSSDSTSEKSTPSPLDKRLLLRFERNDTENIKKLDLRRRTSIYMRKTANVDNSARDEVMLGDVSPAYPVVADELTKYRRVTRVDALPLRPYHAFRDALQEEQDPTYFTVDNNGTRENQSPNAELDNAALAQLAHPNEHTRIVTVEKAGKLFIRIFLGPEKDDVGYDSDATICMADDDATVTDYSDDEDGLIITGESINVEDGSELEFEDRRRSHWGGKTLPKAVYEISTQRVMMD